MLWVQDDVCLINLRKVLMIFKCFGNWFHLNNLFSYSSRRELKHYIKIIKNQEENLTFLSLLLPCILYKLWISNDTLFIWLILYHYQCCFMGCTFSERMGRSRCYKSTHFFTFYLKHRLYCTIFSDCFAVATIEVCECH